LFELSTAIVISIAWGLIMLAFLSLTISREKKENPWESIAEHLIIALVVILITHFVGEFIASMFV
jgi:VIT1/CCC1 family predicted Fe2+/Mn2+ transporter